MERTVFVALVYRGPYGATVEHTQAHVVPLLLTWVLDVVINLSMQRLQTRYAAVTVLERVAFLHVWHCPVITGDKLSYYVSLVSPCPLPSHRNSFSSEVKKFPRTSKKAQAGVQVMVCDKKDVVVRQRSIQGYLCVPWINEEMKKWKVPFETKFTRVFSQ